jgi:hypothetical protein
MNSRAVRRLFGCSVARHGRASRALGLALLISAVALTGTGVVNPSTAVGQDDGNPGVHDTWKADGRGDAELQVIGDTDVANGMYLSWSVPAYSGTHHSEIGTVPPACKVTLRDELYSVRKSNGGVQPVVDPQEPNHVAGQKVIFEPNIMTTTTIKWDLSRDP